ncbi:MAG: putative modification methylase [Prokaryotic dsDNA virus sp.]|nr:MAG: putative modification methylase [Prokaryotic dsDNA virus sp.]|tara:strand:+ start:1602 stop:2747 length:1146 start_codon:yes stop_codon:yes gene_type:complete
MDKDKKITTYGIRYLGSKNKILPLITQVINDLDKQDMRVIDVFTGTTRVAQALKQEGYEVITSDLSWASEVYSEAFICNNGDVSHLEQYIDQLNLVKPKADWLTKHYCNVAAQADPSVNIKVWTKKNGEKADAIREEIESMEIEPWEKSYLIACLIFSLDKLDNTVGLQQAYLKGWKSDRVHKDLVLSPLPGIEGLKGEHISGDALKIAYPSASVAYLDPPYTAADYSTYYHIWDSIARWDKPQVSLKTNRRIDRVKQKTNEKWDKTMKSPWYSKKTALKATKELIDRLPVRYCVFSYSDEGLIKYDEMEDLCSNYESYEFHQQEHDRHVMSRIGAGGDKAENAKKKKNVEYVIVIDKGEEVDMDDVTADYTGEIYKGKHL